MNTLNRSMMKWHVIYLVPRIIVHWKHAINTKNINPEPKINNVDIKEKNNGYSSDTSEPEIIHMNNLYTNSNNSAKSQGTEFSLGPKPMET